MSSIRDTGVTPAQTTSSGLTFSMFVALLLPLLFVIQNPGLKAYFEIESGPKIYHYYLPLFLFIFLPYAQLHRTKSLFAFMIAAILNLLVTATLRPQLLNLVLFLLTVVAASGVDDEHDAWFKKGCIIAAALIFLNIFAHLPAIIESAADNAEGRAIYPTLLAGGINIEASTVLLLLIYALPKSTLLVGAITVFIVFVSKSRAVMLVFVIYLVGIRRGVRLNRRSMAIASSVVVSIGVLAAFTDAGTSFLLRLSDIGNDPGSIGRFMLYEAAFSASDCFLLGCGVGSANDIIQNSRVADFFENNFHNVYLQLLVEMGIAGVLSYILLISSAIKSMKLRNESNAYVVLVSTALLSLIQFTGFEIITAYFIGRGLREFK